MMIEFIKSAPQPIVFTVAGSLVAAFIAATTAFILEMYRQWSKRSEEKIRIHRTIKFLQARFGHIGRHSATNLRRLSELYRGNPLKADLAIALRKMSLGGSASAQQDAPSFELGTIAKIEDISLLPEKLARDALRLDLTARNIEIELAEAIRMLNDELPEFSPMDGETNYTRRIDSLANTIERCAGDSAILVEKLKSFESSLIEWKLLYIVSSQIKQASLSLLFFFFPKGASWVRFDDEPIHYSDAMTLREVGDWVNWKEEQQLISTEDMSAFLKEKMRLGDRSIVEVSSQQYGTINLITRCRSKGTDYCVRVRVNESIFQYEMGLVKEVFTALAMAELKGINKTQDTELADVYRRCISQEIHFKRLSFAIGPDIFYSASKSDIPRKPHPCLITEWVEFDTLAAASNQPAGFRALGSEIKGLHSIKTEHYYRNLRELGEYRRHRQFSDDVIDEIRRRNSDVDVIRTKDMSLLDWLSKILEKVKDFSLCHNDLHPNNVFWNSTDMGEKKIFIIDWDNACISHKYLDFVKIKYWTHLVNGRFTSSDDLFDAFCSGYGENTAKIKSSPVFLSLSLLWLLRVYAFEKRKVDSGKTIQKPFQPPEYYRKEIDECIENLHKLKRKDFNV